MICVPSKEVGDSSTTEPSCNCNTSSSNLADETRVTRIYSRKWPWSWPPAEMHARYWLIGRSYDLDI